MTLACCHLDAFEERVWGRNVKQQIDRRVFTKWKFVQRMMGVIIGLPPL